MAQEFISCKTIFVVQDLLQQLIVTDKVKKFPAFTEPESSSSSQNHATGQNMESDKSSTHLCTPHFFNNVWDRLLVSKQATQICDMERFNLKKLNLTHEYFCKTWPIMWIQQDFQKY
jgi:hypothetical protein